jgi:Uma2 family endonuclease
MLTTEEFQLMSDDELTQTELDQGELIRIPWRSLEHGDLEVELLARMWEFAKPRKLGRVYPGNTGFRLRDDTVRCPDVAFVKQDRLAAPQTWPWRSSLPPTTSASSCAK